MDYQLYPHPTRIVSFPAVERLNVERRLILLDSSGRTIDLFESSELTRPQTLHKSARRDSADVTGNS